MARRTPALNVGFCAIALVCWGASVLCATDKLYEWARADNNDPSINNQLNDCYGLIVSPDGRYVYAITREESSLITLEYDQSTNQMNVIDLKTKGGPGIVGLDHPAAIVMTPDGRHIYVTSPIESSVTHYKRDDETGLLTPQGTWKDGKDEVTSIWGASSMSMSDDGKRLYVAGKTDAAITAFNIEDSGELTVATTVENDAMGGLHTPTAVTSAHDGKYIYVASTTQSMFTVLRRDPTTGNLAVTQRLQDLSKQWGLDAAEACVVSPDDKHVYVLSASGALTVFARYDGNPNEPLVVVRRYLEGLDQTTGLIGGRGMTISKDGSTIFVAAETGKVTMLSRSADGFLTQVGQITAGDVPGVNKATRVAVMPDGGVIVGGWGLVSALETTPNPAGPILPPSTASTPRAPRVPTAPRGPTPVAVPVEPAAPRAPRAPRAPTVGGGGDTADGVSGSGTDDEAESDSVTDGAAEESDYDYVESDEPLGLPPAQIDRIPENKKKVKFPTGTVVGVAGGLLAFTIIAVLADRTATNNFCRPLRKGGRGSDDVDSPYRGGSGAMIGSAAGSGIAMVDAPSPADMMSVPAGADDVVLEAMPLASPQASAPLGGSGATTFDAAGLGDQNV